MGGCLKINGRVHYITEEEFFKPSLTCGGGVQGVVQHLAGHVELQVEACRDHRHHLLLDVGQDMTQQELPSSSCQGKWEGLEKK